VVLFMGWPTRVRGIDFLLKAFSISAKANSHLKLVILARGEGTQAHQVLREGVKQMECSERIEVVEGFFKERSNEKVSQ